uniref:Uncharacterized protein n=1 Tax=Arundo donax TaxID=35708 RepID=A0A0A8YPK7_ARUDO
MEKPSRVFYTETMRGTKAQKHMVDCTK